MRINIFHYFGVFASARLATAIQCPPLYWGVLEDLELHPSHCVSTTLCASEDGTLQHFQYSFQHATPCKRTFAALRCPTDLETTNPDGSKTRCGYSILEFVENGAIKRTCCDGWPSDNAQQQHLEDRDDAPQQHLEDVDDTPQQHLEDVDNMPQQPLGDAAGDIPDDHIPDESEHWEDEELEEALLDAMLGSEHDSGDDEHHEAVQGDAEHAAEEYPTAAPGSDSSNLPG